MTIRTAALTIALGIFTASVAGAQEPIRFARTPDISPDGKLVAFSYLGDIWTVEAIGGVARPVTMHEAHDYLPVFSPDGRHIAFSSNRYGSYDVFVVPTEGGKPRRLTFDSGHDVVNGWTPDGKNVVFTSTRSTAYPFTLDVYTVPVEGGQERKIPLFEGKEAHFSPAGGQLAFVRGPGVWYRKGYRGSSNDDVWVAAADGSNPRRVTTFNGQDTSPMWSPDGKKLYYVTEQLSQRGCANIVCQDLATGTASPPTSGPPRAVTSHQDDAVRRARISGNGERIVYECGGDLWIVATAGGSPRKLAIEVHADDKSNTERTVTLTGGATDYALSPDESHAVVVVHGELFLTKIASPTGKATRLTDHPAFDHSPAWSPDGKKLLFASDRTGVEELYLLEPDDPEHSEFTRAHKFKTKQLTHSRDEEAGGSFSPKGNKIAFIRAGRLWTMSPDGTGEKVLVDTPHVVDYEWSPDGAWIAYSRRDGSFASELYIVPTDGPEKPRNVSRYATYNADVTWSATGGKIGFVSQRRGTFSMHVLSLQKPGASGGSDIDWDDLHLRVTRPAAMPAETGTISPDGTQVAFRSVYNGSDDLWVASADGGSTGRVTSGDQSPRAIRWSKKSTGLIYFLNKQGELRAARASLGGFTGPSGPSGDPLKISFAAKMTVRREEEFAEMFAQSWRVLSDSFYDPQYHGADWNALREKYRPLVDHVAQKEDLYTLVSLMLGELNASHLGISGKLPNPDELTADLGLVFDETYRGPGFKIREVLKRGPADRRGAGLKTGDIVLAADRVELTEKTNLSKLLNNKAGEAVPLDVTSDPADPKARRRVEIVAVPRPKVAHLMYERWVENNAAQITKLSGGKLGYIHIPSMDDDGLEGFMRALYSDNFDKEAIVLDVRYNGGGFTHDQVLNYLAGKEHTFFRQRNGGEGMVLRNYDRKWTKPCVVVTNNQSFSDAEIFPHAFRAAGLGKVVGQATGGQVIGTNQVTLIDGSFFRVPRTGVFTVRGVNMDKEGVVPDVAVEIDPADWAKGTDTQLGKAVGVLEADVVAWKKARGLPGTPDPATPPTKTTAAAQPTAAPADAGTKPMTPAGATAKP
ncbi:S41 family peptidase [Fimbriiglobus ruber]|uniref:Tricorn protease homolog n=1 Tax=Fimbriiglobus ruber TaxID=1908690 RepID=A0A225DEV8_9BACT|nr:S41 family peptidase [Fimbriiglobus ruber]OWK35866.1 tolB protein precursor periplasmic protein [Fimbriiglobus ruber]